MSCLKDADTSSRTPDMTFSGDRAASDYQKYYSVYTPKCKVCAEKYKIYIPCSATGK
jgi:hypothetical protein